MMLNQSSKMFVFIIMILSMFSQCSFADNKMTIAYPEFNPFFFKNKNGKIEGLFYEIITEAIDLRMGINVEWFQMPWKRCQSQVFAGKLDAMITVPTQERSIYCDTHPDPFYRKELKLFTYKNHPRTKEIQHIESIEDIKKGGFIVITYSGNGWHDNNIAILGIRSFETSEVNNVWKMLAAKRGDLVIEWPIGAKVGLGQSGVADKIIETGVSLEPMPFHLLISKQSTYKHILVRFNSVINEMYTDGSIEEILSAYY